MKKTFLLLTFLFVSIQLIAQVRVSGHYRSNGTYVQPHYRSSPDRNPYNNWSYPGNTNPYTGKTATGNPDTYLKNYNSSSSTNSTNYSTGINNYESSSSYGSTYGYSTPSTTSTSFQYKQNSIIQSTQKNTTFKVESSAPIHALPDKNSPTIGTTKSDIIFEGQVNNDFVMVYYNGQHGYLDKMWIDIEGNMKTLKSRKYADLVGKEIPVFLYSPIYKSASIYSEILENADDKKVFILEDVNDEYFLVKYRKVKGYMPKKFVDN